MDVRASDDRRHVPQSDHEFRSRPISVDRHLEVTERRRTTAGDSPLPVRMAL
jgi:hypothetical protein